MPITCSYILFKDLPIFAYSDLSFDVIETWKKGFSEVSFRCHQVRIAASNGMSRQRPVALQRLIPKGGNRFFQIVQRLDCGGFEVQFRDSFDQGVDDFPAS